VLDVERGPVRAERVPGGDHAGDLGELAREVALGVVRGAVDLELGGAEDVAEERRTVERRRRPRGVRLREDRRRLGRRQVPRAALEPRRRVTERRGPIGVHDVRRPPHARRAL